MHEWQVWVIAALVLLGAEMLAPGFWLACVAIGSLVAGLVSAIVPGFLAPTLSFAAGTLLSLAAVHPFLLKHIHSESHGVRTNVDALIGRLGTVDRKSTRMNSSDLVISYAVFCLKKKKIKSLHILLFFKPLR